jgi:hypothetical protein
MMKSPRKLMLRIETVRQLSTMDLARVAAGVDTADAIQCRLVMDSGGEMCPIAFAVIKA